MKLIAIDPGSEQSAYVIYGNVTGDIIEFGIVPNITLLGRIRALFGHFNADELVIEQIASYGMAVGESVFETVFWSGRFVEAWQGKWGRVKRMEVKMHLCGHPRAKDANIRQALIDRFGPPGTKKQPGKTYGVSKDVWAALAVAVTYGDKHQNLSGQSSAN